MWRAPDRPDPIAMLIPNCQRATCDQLPPIITPRPARCMIIPTGVSWSQSWWVSLFLKILSINNLRSEKCAPVRLGRGLQRHDQPAIGELLHVQFRPLLVRNQDLRAADVQRFPHAV